MIRHTELSDASNLLQLFTLSDWNEIAVSTPQLEFYASKRVGCGREVIDDASRIGQSHELQENVTAPHVGTLISHLDVGQEFEKGDTVASLRVLDDDHPLLAACAGRVLSIEASEGNLIEHRQVIMTFEKTGDME